MIKINIRFLLIGLIMLIACNVQISLVSLSWAQNIVPNKQDEQIVQKVRMLVDQIRVISTKSDDLEAIGWGVMTQMEEIGKIGNPALPPIIETLNDAKESWKVRFFMAVILGEVIPDKATIPYLVEIVSNKSEPQSLRVECIQAMGYIGDVSVVPNLISVLQESNTSIKIAAMNTLGRLKDGRSVPCLVSQLDDPDWNIQMVASRALGRIGDPQAVSSLIEKVKGKKVPEENSSIVQAVTVNALSNFKTPEVEQFLISLLKSESAEENIKIGAAIGLGEMKSQKAVDSLSTILSDKLSDKNDLLKKHAAEALVKIGDKKSLELIQRSMEETKSGYVRESLKRAVEKLGAN